MIKRTLLSCVFAVSTAWAQPLELVVDTEKSSVDADVAASPFQSFTAHLDNYDNTIVIDDVNEEVIEAVFDFRFAALKTGKEKRDENMLEWIDIEHFPSAQFKMDEIVSKEGLTRARGHFVMHGVEQPMEIPFTLSIEGKRCVIDGEAEMNYKDYALDKIRMFLFSVDSELKVRFHIEGDLQQKALKKAGI